MWSIGKGLLGDLGDMNFDAIAGKQRASGDINFINSLLQFLADNASIISKVAYGIGSDNGISLGLVGNFLDQNNNDLLAGMEPIDLSIVGELRLDSLDHIAADIDELTSGFVWSIGKGLLGDLGDMNFDAIAGKQRASGDINFINSLLQFLADNASIVSKAAYGIGSDNGISLGLVGNFLDLGDIGDICASGSGYH